MYLKRNFLIIILLFVGLFAFTFYYNSYHHTSKQSCNALISDVNVFILNKNDTSPQEDVMNVTQTRVKTIDLSQKLIPHSIYSHITCRKSANFKTETLLCLHDILVEGLSKEIWKEGRVEPYVLGKRGNKHY